jgi:hypothetical protein
MSFIQRLTENVSHRDLRAEGSALVKKWESLGLLEGLSKEIDRKNMAVLLENQAKQLLKEVSSMAGGDVEGFASVAFPIVRRVFGGLLANNLVSVQSMSLPSGLIFFLDFTYTHSRNMDAVAGASVYGGGVVGQQTTGGVNLTYGNAERSFYSLNNGYSSPTGTIAHTFLATNIVASGTVGGTWTAGIDGAGAASNYTVNGDALCQFDPDLSGSYAVIMSIAKAAFVSAQFNTKNFPTITPRDGGPAISGTVRRLTKDDPYNTANYLFVVAATASTDTTKTLSASCTQIDSFTFAIDDDFIAGGALGSVVGDNLWGMEQAGQTATGLQDYIPELDIKVDSVSVEAVTKKLKAKWTTELGQDLNAYHNIDAEVELTSLLSEHITLEIDREILTDLIKGATGATLYWSRHPGFFVNRETGTAAHNTTSPPDFTGNVSEWYETLVETINDASARMHRKTLRGGANAIVCSPEVASILEMTRGFKADIAVDDDKGDIGTFKTGSISRKFEVYVDPYMIRNLILVVRKGSSFLESGYVYAPYVALQTSPTIPDPESFMPRKAVWTRYGKKLVKSDFYALVVVRHLTTGTV